MKHKIIQKKIDNWSLTLSQKSKIHLPENLENLKQLLLNFKKKKSNFSIIGGGNSYGDCFLNKKKNIIDLKRFYKIIKIDFKNRFVVLQSGVRLEKILNIILKKNFILNSLPGTYMATIGGVISSNVHGKDSFKNGVFANNIIELKILNARNQIVVIKKNSRDLKSYVGTFGLKGVILEAKLKLTKTKGDILKVKTEKFYSINQMTTLFSNYSKNSNYMGAWIDHFSKKGIGIFKCAKWCKRDQKYKNYLPKKKNISYIRRLIYFLFNNIIISRLLIIIFNKLLMLISYKSTRYQSFYDFYYPQEKFLPNESMLFKEGKVNIQIIIPEKKFFIVMDKIFKLTKEYKFESWWLGLKKHLRQNYLNVFALDGYDITLQWSKNYIKKNSFKLFKKKLFNIIHLYNCKIYLTQDISMNSQEINKIYNFKNFRSNKNKIFSNLLSDRILGNK